MIKNQIISRGKIVVKVCFFQITWSLDVNSVITKIYQAYIFFEFNGKGVLKAVAKEIVQYAPDATYIIVSNPVDILTYVFCKTTGIPEKRVIGSGTILDTSRLRARIAEYYSVNQKNVHAYILGEHGDTAFVPWSIANISNVPFKSANDTLNA